MLVNTFTVRPNELKEGTVMAVTVTCHIMQGMNGLTYRLYRCPYPGAETVNGVPQGDRIYPSEMAPLDVILLKLFPAVVWADPEIKEDF